MRLIFLIPKFPGQTHAFFWREILAMRQMHAEVRIVSTHRPSPDVAKHEFAREAMAEIYYLMPPRFGRAILQLLLRPIRTLKAVGYVLSLRETPLRQRIKHLGAILLAADLLQHAKQDAIDHIHAHSCGDAAHIVAICHCLGGPSYSLTLHGDLPVYGKDHAQKMRHAQFVSCVTRALQAQVAEKIGLPMEKLPVIWMGVDTDRFAPVASADAEAGQLRIVTVARLNRAKGHRHALKAARLAVDRGVNIQYTIAGTGTERESIEAMINELGLQRHVTLAGTLSEQQVLELLQRGTDVFVLPSVGLGEAAPVSVMEAMACGVPVISSIIGGTPDMITTDVDGILVKQGDEEAIAEAFVTLAGDPGLRRRLGAGARERAVQRFDYRSMARLLLDELNRASGRPTPAAP